MSFSSPSSTGTRSYYRGLSGAGRKNLWLGLAALAGITTAVLAKDAYVGSKPKLHVEAGKLRTDAAMQDLNFVAGRFSGLPWLDSLAKQTHRHLAYGGPFNIGWYWTEFCNWANVMVNDVLGKVALPLAVAVGSLYAGLGANTVNKPFKNVYHFVRKHLELPGNWKAGMMRACGSIGRVAMRGVNWSIRNWPVALGGAALLGFIYSRFEDVYNNETQRDYFMPQIMGEE